jgi:hypothetical protein
MDELKLTIGNSVAGITYRLHLPPTPPHSPSTLSTLALIKTSPLLDSLLPLGSQLHFVLLSSSSAATILVQDDGTTSGASTVVTTPSAQATPYDGLHSLVHWGVAPWFDSYVSSKQGLNEVVSAKKGNEAQMGESATNGYELMSRYPSHKEEICRTRIVAFASQAERGDSRSSTLGTSGGKEGSRTGQFLVFHRAGS